MRRVAFILLWLYAFTLPWDYMLQFGEPIGSAGRVAGLLAFAGCLAMVAASGWMRRLLTFHIAAAVYLAVVALSVFWTADPKDAPHAVRVYVQSIMVVWLLWELGSNRRALFHLAVAYVAGAHVAALGVFHTFSTEALAPGAKEARFAADNWDVNDIALVLALAIPLSFYVASQRAHWTSTWLARAYLILGPMAIVLTSSRSGIVVTAIALCSLPLFLRRQTAMAKLAMVLVLAGAGYLAWNYAPQQSWNRLSTLYSSIRAGDLDGRELIWQTGWRAFGAHCLAGVGPGAFQAGVGTYYSAHNTFLAVLVEQGLVGFSVFSVILGGALYSAMRLKKDERWTCIFLLLCWTVGAFTLDWALNRVTWFVLAFVVSCGKADQQATPFFDAEAAWGATLPAEGRG
jgi:O-antigen ligase